MNVTPSYLIYHIIIAFTVKSQQRNLHYFDNNVSLCFLHLALLDTLSAQLAGVWARPLIYISYE
jgi:hypothetical protein